MTDEIARQALIETARHIDEMRAAVTELQHMLADTRDRLSMLSVRQVWMSERVSEIEARMHNDGK